MHIRVIWKKDDDDPKTDLLVLARDPELVIGCVFDMRGCFDKETEDYPDYYECCGRMEIDGSNGWYDIGYARTKRAAKLKVEKFFRVEK
jgi:hypothetical protein